MEENLSQESLNLESIGPSESMEVDLWQHDKKEVIIEKAEVIKVPSKFTSKIKDPDSGEETSEHHKQWVLKVSSEVLDSIGEGESKTEFRASELFNLIQDNDGNLTGFPTGEGSNLMKFVSDLKIENLDKFHSLKQVIDTIVGRKVMVKAYDVTRDGRERTFLKFRY